MANFQWTIKKLAIADLRAYEKNPRTLSEKQYKDLSDSLDKFGLIDKPVVNTDNTIIGGHQRIEVLRAQGVLEVEVNVPDHLLNEKEVEELNIRCNRNNGSWNYDILANEFDVGDLLSWGFDERDLGLGEEEKPKKKEKFVISLEFSEKDTMLEYIEKCEEIAQDSSAKMKVRG